MRFLQILLLGILLYATGCGSAKKSGVLINGTVTKDGTPIKIGDSEGLTIVLTEGSNKFTAHVDAIGQFSVQQPNGDGIPPGKYKVSYTHYQGEDPYKKVKPFKIEKELPEPWDVSPQNTKFTLEIGKK